MDAARVFHNLKIVSQLSQNDKLITEGLTFGIRRPSMWREVTRMWYGERREHVLMSVQSLMSEAMNILALLTQVSEPSFKRLGMSALATCTPERMLEAIRMALPGIRNLLQTYQGDVSICAKLQVIIQDTEEFIRALLAQNPELSATVCRAGRADDEESEDA